MASTEFFSTLMGYFQHTELEGQISCDSLLGINRKKMLLLIGKKKDEGFHVLRVEDVLVFGLRQKVFPRFLREMNESCQMDLAYFLHQPTGFRSITEDYNLRDRPVLKSFFIYYAEKRSVMTVPTADSLLARPRPRPWICECCSEHDTKFAQTVKSITDKAGSRQSVVKVVNVYEKNLVKISSEIFDENQTKKAKHKVSKSFCLQESQFPSPEARDDCSFATISGLSYASEDCFESHGPDTRRQSEQSSLKQHPPTAKFVSKPVPITTGLFGEWTRHRQCIEEKLEFWANLFLHKEKSESFFFAILEKEGSAHIKIKNKLKAVMTDKKAPLRRPTELVEWLLENTHSEGWYCDRGRVLIQFAENMTSDRQFVHGELKYPADESSLQQAEKTLENIRKQLKHVVKIQKQSRSRADSQKRKAVEVPMRRSMSCNDKSI